MPDDESIVPKAICSRKPLVSIIVPCYNGQSFIAEAIESAQAQTYRNIEIVVVDDGSTDGTPAIVSCYPVRFVQESHRGVSAARNRGIIVSKGEYLVFLIVMTGFSPVRWLRGLKLWSAVRTAV